MIGNRYERLLVIASAGKNHRRELQWLCRCDCGVEKVIWGWCLRNGNTRSCGCLATDRAREVHTTTGSHENAEYMCWAMMKQRCNNPDATGYHKYGGRGIKVCDQWDDFAVFLADMGSRPGANYSIERIDNDGDYEPGNCRWATGLEQGQNTRRTRYVVYRGVRMSFSELARRCGIHKNTLGGRLARGWAVEDAAEKATNR